MGDAILMYWGCTMIINETDIMMNLSGQPVPLASGAESIAEGIDSFFQDVRNEAITAEGECFFDSQYGWSLLDFVHRDFNELEELKIKNRIREKLKSRDEINQHSILITVEQGQDDDIRIHLEFKIKNGDVSYQMNLGIDGTEVKSLD